MKSHHLIAAFAISLISIALGSNALAQGQPICKPSVELESKPCGANQVQTFAKATNGCLCDVTIDIKLRSGGTAIFVNVERNGGSGTQMIETCGPRMGGFREWSYKFSCPTANREQKPRDLSTQLRAAASDAKGADLTNVKQLADLESQHTDTVRASIARYQSEVRSWCANNGTHCDMQCTRRNGGSVEYMNACVKLCRAVVDACISGDLDSEPNRSAAEARVRSASSNMKRVIRHLNEELRQQRELEEMDAALNMQQFIGTLSAMSAIMGQAGSNTNFPPGAARQSKGGGGRCKECVH